MTTLPPSLPLPMIPAPDPVDAELEPLLSDPLASAWELPESEARTSAAGLLRSRLLARVAGSQASAAPMTTSRRRRQTLAAPAPGVSLRALYTAPRDRALRPGEPLHAWLVELAPGSEWRVPGPACHREWLLLQGQASIDGQPLQLRDYLVVPAGAATACAGSGPGARLFLRESALPVRPGEGSLLVRDAQAGWPDFAPGIRRRVLWQRDGEAALLYLAQPGASVPQHTHGHDEECLMVQGELFLDDVLLQEGDYQLAPAGTGHRITETDTGVVIYAHGDLDLKFIG